LPDYCCPSCKQPLESAAERYRCRACGRDYPVVLGIPDFRLFPDPFLDVASDHRKGQRLAERAPHTDFEGLLRYYWSITPEEPEDLVQRYVRYDLAGVARGSHALDVVDAELPASAGAARTVLELGSRTGGFLVAAAERALPVAGIDIAFRWLVVARKRLEGRGLTARLACCCAQFLPFPPAAFDLVVAGNVLEHTHAQEELIAEAGRVLRPGGALFAVTCNRYSIAPEPHVRVWGVGFLPRRWMSSYVRLVRGHAYDNVRLPSVFELRRMARRSFATCRLSLPTLSEAEQQGLPDRERHLAALYLKIKDWPIVRPLLLVFGPLLQVVCVRKAASAS